MFTWPWRLLLPSSQKTMLQGRAVTGGASISGIVQSAATSGGGYWMTDLTGIWLHTPDQIRCARAWSAYLDGGATQFVMPVWDLAQAPRPIIGGAPALPGSAAPSGDYFAQQPGFGSPMIVASIIGSAALRAASVVISISRGTRLYGGEHFSIQHPTLGWRLYRVARVTAASGTAYTCTIRPPLREALSGGEAAEFDVPRCTMMLNPGRAGDLEPDLEGYRMAKVNGSFMEAF